jgi:hypothetical protein
LGWKSCQIAGKYGELKAKYDEAKKVAEADHEILTNTIAEKGKEIDKLTKDIAIIIANSHKPTPAEIAKDKELAELRKSWANLSAECQARLHELDKVWSDKFDLTVKRYEGVIFTLNSTWSKKFDAQVVISQSWEKKFNIEHSLRLLADTALGAADAKIRILQFGGNIKTILVVVASGYIGYRLITKK